MAVFDASALVGLIVELPWSERARHAIQEDPERISPSIVGAEIGNALWLNVRANNLSAENAEAALKRTISLLVLVSDEELVGSALVIAIEQNHPIYDCLYLALARREDAPLFTADRKLASLASRIGIKFDLVV